MSVMVETPPVEQNRSMQSVMALIADVLGVLFFLATSGYFIGRFGRNSVDMTALGTAALFVLTYLGFVVGMVLIRKQRSFHSPYSLLANRRLLAVLAVLFAVSFVMVVAHLTGYLSLIFDINFGDMGNSYYFLVTPAVYLFVGLLYLFILTQPIEADRTSAFTTLAGLTLVNLFTATSASYLASFKSTTFEDWNAVGVGVAVYLILAVFFLLPRLIHFDKTRDLISLITFDLMLIAFAFLVAVS